MSPYWVHSDPNAPSQPKSVIDCPDCGDRGWNLRDREIQVCHCGTFDAPKWVLKGERPCLIEHYTAPDEQPRPRRAATGWLCRGHRAGLEEKIDELRELYDELGDALTSSEKPNNEGGHAKHGQVAGGVNLNKNVVEARDEIQAECWRMSREIHEATRDDLPTADTVTAVVAWLVVRCDWIADQDDVDEWYANLDRLTRYCRGLVKPSGRQRIDLTQRTGRACQTVTSCDVTTHEHRRCGGSLRATLTGGGWGTDEGKLTCGCCGEEKPITLVALADFGETA